MDNNQQVNDMPNTEQNAGGNSAPVYSQMSLDFVANQVKVAKKKGRIQGILIGLAGVLLVCGIGMGVSIIKMIANGTIYSELLSINGGSVLNRETSKKIDDIYRIINNTYMDEYTKDSIREGMYKGMLESLDDPYSVYYTKEEYEELMEDSSGVFEGIGAYLQQDPDTMVITIVRPIKHSPAEEAGLHRDDILVEVDGEDITGQDLNLVVSKVRGPEGSTVNIGVVRQGESDILHFDIVRAEVISESVESEMMDNNIGYIHISEFADHTDTQFVESYDELLADGMESMILDLRTNGGGYVDTAVGVAQRLVKEGTIVSLKDRDGKGYSYEDEGDDKYIDIPCVVLVDGNTASASEILTAALKDYGIATIIGTKTFGKGIVQDVIPLSDGSGLKITNSKYYSPNGENIHKIGIEPDIEVGWDYEMYKKDGTDNQLEAAKQYLTDGKIDDKYIPDKKDD